MEFDLQLVLILVGGVVIAGIALDGYRRMRKSKIGELKLPSELGGSCEDEWEYFRGELPNGGARKMPRSARRSVGEDYAGQGQEDDDFGPAIDDAELAYGDPGLAAERPQQRSNTIPGRKLGDDKEYQQAYAEHQEAYEADDYEADEYEPEHFEPEPMARKARSQSGRSRQTPQPAEYQHEAETALEDERDQTDLFTDDDLLVASRAEQQAQLNRKTTISRQREPKPAEPEIDSSLHEVFVINVMAKQGELEGAELLRVMLSCGFRFGEMNIFHRYEQHSGKGGLLFSAANVVEPGVFDLDKMSEFSTPGICIFMELPGPKRPIHAFEIMMDSARKIAKLLDADIKDENHNVLRQQTAEHYRQRVLDFERKLLSYRGSQRQY
jgi:cell division protein ZipA